MTKDNLVTIYASGYLGVRKHEGRLIEHGTRKYAQYNNAPYVHFIPKRKRRARAITGDYRPYIVVLKGHGHPDLAV